LYYASAAALLFELLVFVVLLFTSCHFFIMGEGEPRWIVVIMALLVRAQFVISVQPS